jgi:hypothetical protein
MIVGQEVTERTNSPRFFWSSTNKGSFTTDMNGRIFNSLRVWYNYCNDFSSETTRWPVRTTWKTAADHNLPNNVLGNWCQCTYWLIDYTGWDWRLRTAASTGLLFIPLVNVSVGAVVMIPTGDNSWLVSQSSLAVLAAETSGVSGRNGRRSENFAYSVSFIRILYTPYILTTWDSRLYFPSKGRCAADFYRP